LAVEFVVDFLNSGLTQVSLAGHQSSASIEQRIVGEIQPYQTSGSVHVDSSEIPVVNQCCLKVGIEAFLLALEDVSRISLRCLILQKFWQINHGGVLHVIQAARDLGFQKAFLCLQ